MKIKAKIFAAIIIIVAGAYAIGSGFTDYALRRGTDTSPASPPPACAKIADPSLVAPEKPQAKSELWSITSADGLKLVATYFAPDVPSRRWAILVHGYGRNQRFAWDYAAEYLAQGYNVVTPDLRASGLSEGEYLTMGTKESEDIVLWAQEIAKHDDAAKIILHGVSMGAATVMLATAQEPPNVVAAVEDCGYTSAYTMFTAQLDKLFGLPPFPIMNCVDVVSRIKTGTALSAATPVEAVKSTKVPMLFIHGDVDELVPFAMMGELYDASAAPVKEQYVVRGAGHADAKRAAPAEYFAHVFAFLQPYVGNTAN